VSGETIAQTTRRLLDQAGTRARKSLGQHFLVSAGALAGITEAAELTPSDTVIEVGPGPGALTAELLARAGRVIAVELDGTMLDLLARRFSSVSNLTLVREDILKIMPAALLAKAGLDAGTSFKVVANLPYYITSPVLRHFLEGDARPSLMVVTVQKEVAQSVAAAPGDMSLLGVSVQFYAEAKIAARIPAGAFMPPPKVDSAVLKLRLYRDLPVPPSGIAGFFKIVRAGFCANRKQLVNSLAQGLAEDKERVRALLERAGIDPGRRAETLTVAEWVILWRASGGEDV